MILALSFVAFVVAWVLPGHYIPWTTFQQEIAAAIGGLLAGLAFIASPVAKRLVLGPVSIFAIALGVVPMLQWSLGQFPYLADGALPFLYAVGFGLTAAVSGTFVRAGHVTPISGLHAAMLAACLLSCAAALYQWLPLGPSGWVEVIGPTDRVFANFTQPNHFAVLMAFGMTSVLWLFEKRRVGIAVACMSLLFFGFALVMSESRAGWMFVGLLASWTLIGRRTVHLRTHPMAVLTAIAVFAAMTVLWAPLNIWLNGAPPTTVLADRATELGGRSILWQVMWDAALQKPIFGWGWLQVPRAQLSATLSFPANYEWLTYSHNGILDLFVWLGIPLGLFVTGAVAYWLFSRARACNDPDKWALLGLLGVVLAHSLVEFPYAYLYFLLPAAIAAGAIEAGMPSHSPAQAVSLPKWGLAVATLGMAGGLATIAIDYLTLDEQSRRARFLEAGYDFDGVKPTVPAVRLLDNQRDLLWLRLTEARTDMTAAELDRMQKVAQRYLPPAALLRYAMAAGLNQRPDDARLYLEYLCNLSRPRNCDDGRTAWLKAQESFPQLTAVNFPGAPLPH